MAVLIRNLLALVVLAALTFFAWRSHQEVQDQRMRLAKLTAEIELAEEFLQLEHPRLHQALLASVDHYDAIHAIREQCETTGMELLREKYGTIKPYPDRYSILGLPSMRGETGRMPQVIGVQVPGQGRLWLQYVIQQKESPSAEYVDLVTDPIAPPVVDHAGPYEAPLPPGQHVVSISVERSSSGISPLRITLDDQLMLDTLIHSDVRGAAFTLGRTRQLNYRLGDISWLALRTNNFKRWQAEQSEQEKSYRFRIWLSEDPRGFPPFPGKR